MIMMDATLSEGLARVRKRFVAELRPRRDTLALLREEGEQTKWAQEQVMSVGRIAHKIAGTAATVGFAKLGAIAAELDDLTTQDGNVSEMSRNELARLLESVIALADHILAEQNS